MQLAIEWKKPINLALAENENEIYQFDVNKIEPRPGVYIFGRLHGKKFEALYIGKANNLQNRTKKQLESLKLMMHIKNSKTGRKILIIGIFKPRPGQSAKNCLPIIEKALIRHFLSEGNNIANIHGTIIDRHEIYSSGLSHVPAEIFVDRVKDKKKNNT